MRYTYDLNESGCLILRADSKDKARILESIKKYGTSTAAEIAVLDPLIANSELTWIEPEEIGALTDAPILGMRGADGKPTMAWGFMDYQVRSFLDDLLTKGKAVFVS